MKEVGAGAVCLVDPNSIQSIRSGVLKVINDDVYRQELIDKGLKNVLRFNAEVIAGQYLACYEKIASLLHEKN